MINDLNNSMGFLLNACAKKLKRDIDSRLLHYDLTGGQWAVLKTISGNEGITQVILKEKLQSDKATTGTIVKKLIIKKLIIRKPSSYDKRAYRLYLTEYAQSIMADVEKSAEQANQTVEDKFSEEELISLKELLLRILSNDT